MTDTPSSDNCIEAFVHCDNCLSDCPHGKSPRQWASLEVGFTEIGLQVWCKRCEMNVMHIDFEGQQHPASTSRNLRYGEG